MGAVDAGDFRAVGELAGRGLAATTGLIRDTHVAIADRAFRLSGPVAKPVQVVHDAMSRSVYATVGSGLRVAGAIAGRVADRKSETAPSSVVVGALNGA